jgi:pimeloyl-ACP methyl ester carboxylesterase
VFPARLFRQAGVAALTIAAATIVAHAQQPAAPPMKAPERFTVRSDGHPMAVWARRPAAPKGAILLVHGRTWSSLPDFDLQVPGLQRSVLASFAAQGFAAYAIDLRGYGATPRDSTGWLTPKRSVDDIINVLERVSAQHPSLPKPTVVGWSRGAIMSGMAAQSAPDRVSNVVMFGFASDPDLDVLEIEAPEKPAKDKNTAAGAESDFISPDVTPRSVVAAFVEQALKTDPILVDTKNDGEFNQFKPGLLTTPTLVLFGSEDPGLAIEDAGKMFATIAARDKAMVVLPGADHAAQLEDTHEAWIAAIVNFINRPPVRR